MAFYPCNNSNYPKAFMTMCYLAYTYAGDPGDAMYLHSYIEANDNHSYSPKTYPLIFTVFEGTLNIGISKTRAIIRRPQRRYHANWYCTFLVKGTYIANADNYPYVYTPTVNQEFQLFSNHGGTLSPYYYQGATALFIFEE